MMKTKLIIVDALIVSLKPNIKMENLDDAFFYFFHFFHFFHFLHFSSSLILSSAISPFKKSERILDKRTGGLLPRQDKRKQLVKNLNSPACQTQPCSNVCRLRSIWLVTLSNLLIRQRKSNPTCPKSENWNVTNDVDKSRMFFLFMCSWAASWRKTWSYWLQYERKKL